MARERLPNRRPSETVELEFEGVEFAICVGFYFDGRPAEVFTTGAKVGSHLDAILDDASILVSLLLQHEVAPAAIAKSMSRVDRSGEPGSIVGALADLLAHEARTRSPADATAAEKPGGTDGRAP